MKGGPQQAAAFFRGPLMGAPMKGGPQQAPAIFGGPFMGPTSPYTPTAAKDPKLLIGETVQSLPCCCGALGGPLRMWGPPRGSGALYGLLLRGPPHRYLYACC